VIPTAKYKTSVYTQVNRNTQKVAHQKQHEWRHYQSNTLRWWGAAKVTQLFVISDDFNVLLPARRHQDVLTTVFLNIYDSHGCLLLLICHQATELSQRNFTMLHITSTKEESLHCALAAVQCIVIGPVCVWVCLWVGLLPR